jgi:UDP-glucose 4-epimerase
VVDELVEGGHETWTFDRRPPERGEYVEGDLTSLNDVVAATAGFDALCHLGAVGDVYLAAADPPLAASLNVVGTANVMEAARRNGLRKVVYASTWEVYGHALYQPIDEEHPCAPDHPYNITKWAGEQLALSYSRLKGVPTIALRLGTAFGPRMRPNSVFSVFVDRALRKEPIEIHGDGTQTRQFTHARDIAHAFRLAVESDLTSDVVNVVAPENVSIRQLAELVAAELPTEVRFRPARLGDVEPTLVSADKAQRVLGWQPRVPFREGLRDLIEARVGAVAARR